MKSKTVKKSKKITVTPKSLNELWAKVVKLKADNKCEYCGKETYLNSHHIFSRSKCSTRWDIENGICLCSGHHILSSKFSAHQTPVEFVEWIKEYRDKYWYERLRYNSKQIVKCNMEFKRNTYNTLKKLEEQWTENTLQPYSFF